ncbi:para-nitrobenzyl esterase [Povalibacter uvarum]|uniref:Carboxylic ester hydrolase n=1 Tax=Povalibacter uvarum TaxID=732238 RepID=A0A841HNW3_9GAMM|nr:carboxylesterase family protein [Povalibacter uvarum]MBB6094019.1 para-nitrobenzyl esterase [Povalibacter uvarum]
MKLSRRELIAKSLVLAAGTLPGGSLLAQPASQSVVETAQGRVRGSIAPNGVHVFKGMRYAGSSAGVLRFMPPTAPPRWAGIQDALEYGDQSPQARSSLAAAQAMSDDCLRINVWTPGADGAKRPVMLWFHGGGFEAGAGSIPLYDGTRMARRGDVVVATINHRLNVFGNCYLGGVLGDDFAQSGNVGYLDLIASMRWVKENIARFGGDPDNVMIYGQSGGGRKVSLCYAGRDAQGLFHKGVVQSGSHLKVQTTERANELTEQLLKELGIAANDARKLQTIDVETLSAAQRKVIAAAGARFSPVLDGRTFTAHPFLPDAPAISNHLPMMLGTTRTELTNQMGRVPGIFEMNEAQAKERLKGFLGEADIDEAYRIFQASRPQANPSEVFFTIASARGYVRDQTIMAEQRVKAGGAGKTYVYRLMWRQPVEGGRRVSQHSLDLPFMFDNVAAVPHMTGPETEATRAMVDTMANSWIAFARTGNPNNPSVPAWAPYDLERRNTMLFDVPSTAVDDPHQSERLFMARYPSQQDGGNALHRQSMD